MYDIKKTENFEKWLIKLKDTKGKIAVARSIDKMQNGNFGDSRPIGEGLSELRLTIGPGYRVYYMIKNKEIIILLNGGDKSKQQSDIKTAKQLAKEYKS
ncbi:MAG: addiction module antitoxin RelB [Arcobacter sp.]|nr:MAG: addiction module antitoxin RelB [Arcobacter sp.]